MERPPKRNNYIKALGDEIAIIAYFDLANMFHWQNTLGWRFRIEDLISQILSIAPVREVKVYYGLNERDINNSMRFHSRIRKAGAILITKPVKYIRKTIKDSLILRKSTINLFGRKISKKLYTILNEMERQKILIEEPKCNFDVEMTMDILDDSSKISGVIVFSGDSDLKAPLQRIKKEGKKIYIVGVRGMTSAELHAVKNYFIDFGKFYNGKRNYAYKCENPARKRDRAIR